MASLGEAGLISPSGQNLMITIGMLTFFAQMFLELRFGYLDQLECSNGVRMSASAGASITHCLCIVDTLELCGVYP